MWGVLPLLMQLTETTNRCHVSPSMLGQSATTRRLLWQWGLCVIPGCQPVCPRVLFPSNLHLTFRLTALLSPFSWLISFEEIIFEPQHRLTDSDDTTDNTLVRVLTKRVTRCYSHGYVPGTVVFNKLSANWPLCCVPAGSFKGGTEWWTFQLRKPFWHVHTQKMCYCVQGECYKNLHGFNNNNVNLKKIHKMLDWPWHWCLAGKNKVTPQ